MDTKTKKNKLTFCSFSMTLKFNRVLNIVEVHVRAKCYQAKCSGSWLIVVTVKPPKTATTQKTILSSRR